MRYPPEASTTNLEWDREPPLSSILRLTSLRRGLKHGKQLIYSSTSIPTPTKAILIDNTYIARSFSSAAQHHQQEAKRGKRKPGRFASLSLPSSLASHFLLSEQTQGRFLWQNYRPQRRSISHPVNLCFPLKKKKKGRNYQKKIVLLHGETCRRGEKKFLLHVKSFITRGARGGGEWCILLGLVLRTPHWLPSH